MIPPAKREIAPNITASVYPTGAGSPISEVYVIDLKNTNIDTLTTLTTNGKDGHIRLYRGIEHPFVQTKGANYFSNDINIALGCALGGKTQI